MPVSDEEILELFKAEESQERAFRLLVDKYSERLYYQIRSLVSTHEDTDDVLQNVLVKVWRHMDKFREDAKLSTWLYRIAYNESITFLKKRKKHISESLEERHDQPIAGTFTDGEAIQQQLQAAIEQLPEKQRLVFHMRYYEEMPYEEMSEVLGTSVGALKASYHHAAKKIEAYLTGG